MSLPPVERSISVSWDPGTAFRRFTGEFGSWWPYRSFSIGGERIRRIVFEPKTGGRIYEEHRDGRRFQWGIVQTWEPPHRVKFSWHPSRDPSGAQDVNVEFVPEGSGTLVKLTSANWENWGAKASSARRGYSAGWNYVLNVMAGRRTARMAMLDLMISTMTLVQKFKGGRDGVIASSRGEISNARSEEAL